MSANTETPRTFAATQHIRLVRNFSGDVVAPSFAEQLERELADANALIAELQQTLSGRTVSCELCNEVAKERDEMRESIRNLEDQRDCAMGLLAKAEAQIVVLREALEAGLLMQRPGDIWSVQPDKIAAFCKLAKQALSASPPPVVAKDLYAAAEKDAEDLAESARVMHDDLKLCYQAFLDQHSKTKRLSFSQGFQLGKRLAGYWATTNQALTAHDSRKTAQPKLPV